MDRFGHQQCSSIRKGKMQFYKGKASAALLPEGAELFFCLDLELDWQIKDSIIPPGTQIPISPKPLSSVQTT
jgi:hypothetical protein